MDNRTRLGSVAAELRHHAPFTLIGALTGVGCMLLFRQAGPGINGALFRVFHPGHVVLSALVTVSLYKLRSGRTGLLTLAAIGYVGSIGVATLSDCVVPFFGDAVLGVVLPTHAAVHGEPEAALPEEAVAEHGHDHAGGATADDAHAAEHGHEGLHLGFIEDWYLVNPAAFLGILLAFWIPHERLHTKLPHAGHVLISTWASSFYVLAHTERALGPGYLLGLFAVLFLAVWLPCCISDIVFPTLFLGAQRVPHCCPLHRSSEPVSHG